MRASLDDRSSNVKVWTFYQSSQGLQKSLRIVSDLQRSISGFGLAFDNSARVPAGRQVLIAPHQQLAADVSPLCWLGSIASLQSTQRRDLSRRPVNMSAHCETERRDTEAARPATTADLWQFSLREAPPLLVRVIH